MLKNEEMLGFYTTDMNRDQNKKTYGMIKSL